MDEIGELIFQNYHAEYGEYLEWTRGCGACNGKNTCTNDATYSIWHVYGKCLIACVIVENAVKSVDIGVCTGSSWKLFSIA